MSTRCRVQKPRKVAVRLFNQACSGVLKQHVFDGFWVKGVEVLGFWVLGLSGFRDSGLWFRDLGLWPHHIFAPLKDSQALAQRSGYLGPERTCCVSGNDLITMASVV